ncbi:hypothetical protein ACJX0J_024324, partial [Zea mays]
ALMEIQKIKVLILHPMGARPPKDKILARIEANTQETTSNMCRSRGFFIVYLHHLTAAMFSGGSWSIFFFTIINRWNSGRLQNNTVYIINRYMKMIEPVSNQTCRKEFQNNKINNLYNIYDMKYTGVPISKER